MQQPEIAPDSYYPVDPDAMVSTPRFQKDMEELCFEWAYADVANGGGRKLPFAVTEQIAQEKARERDQENNGETPVDQSDGGPQQPLRMQLDPEEMAQKGVQQFRQSISSMSAALPGAAAQIKITSRRRLPIAI